MLVAKRDPLYPGARDNSHSDFAAVRDAPRAPRLARTLGALQMIGTLLAIPLGIGSAYTMYRANFSVESTCQNLRANIVSMLDKSVDASTRHMLVRKDVVSFEQTCSGVDPDATAAFKALLASEQAAPPPAHAEAKPVEEKPQDIVRKTDSKLERHEEVAAQAKQAERDATLTDAAWLAVVRGALTSNDAEPVKPAKAQAAVHPRPELRATLPSTPLAAVEIVPALPPAATIATVPAPPPDADHPVPPASVPIVAETQPRDRAHRSWVGQIPFVGKMIESK
jgi:hypothetical protein